MFRFLLILIFLLFSISFCTPVDSNNDRRQNDRDERRGRDRDRDRIDRFDDEEEDDDDSDDFEFDLDDGLDLDDDDDDTADSSPFNPSDDELDLDQTAEAESVQAAVKVIEPLKQQGIKSKIDFLFIIDSSKENMPYISAPKLKDKLGGLPIQLSNIGIEWRFYFLNSEFKMKTSTDQTFRNGKLMDLEYNGAIVISQYLDNDIASFYNDQVSELFIDTIEHDIITSSGSSHCKFPPYCHNKENSRPLKVLHNFLLESKNVLREKADLFVVILSNRDEAQPKKKRSTKSAPVDQAIEASEVVDRFKNLYPDKRIYTASIVVKGGDENCKAENKDNIFGSYISHLSMLTRGLIVNICSVQTGSYSSFIINWLKKSGTKENDTEAFH